MVLTYGHQSEEITNDTEAMQYEFVKVFKNSGCLSVQVKHDEGITESFFMTVEPNFGGKNLSEMKLLTVISRCIGDFKRWPEFFESINGYNALHFAPI